MDALAIASAVISVLLAVIAYFLHKTLERVDLMRDQLTVLIERFDSMEEDVVAAKGHDTAIKIMRAEIRALQNKYAGNGRRADLDDY